MDVSQILSLSFYQKHNCPPQCGGQLIIDSIVSLRLNSFRNHSLKEDLKRHGMSTAVMGYEKLTVATVHTVIKRHVVIIIVSMKSKIKLVEEETISLFSITSGFLSLTNHSIVHFIYLLSEIRIKKAREDTRAFRLNSYSFVGIYSHKNIYLT